MTWSTRSLGGAGRAGTVGSGLRWVWRCSLDTTVAALRRARPTGPRRPSRRRRILSQTRSPGEPRRTVRRRVFLAPLVLVLATTAVSCGADDHHDAKPANPDARPRSQRAAEPTSIPPHTGRVLYVAPRGSDTGPGSFAR